MATTGLSYRLPTRAVQMSLALAVLGAVATAAGLALEPRRAWPDLFLASNYLLGLGLAGLLLVALHDVTGARWSAAVRPVGEAMAAALPVGGLGLIVVLLFRPSLYSWTVTSDSAESSLRHLWLTRPFFLLRAFVYLGLWCAFAFAMVRSSRRREGASGRRVLLSAVFLVVFGLTFWLATQDWIMSLEPEWASTMYGVYNFAGLFVSGLAAAVLIVIGLRKYGPLRRELDDTCLHDLGTLLFAFSSFWMYTWFCQYMLIWYVNNPEETVYYRQRWHGNWPLLAIFDLALNWGIPFLVLLFRWAKRSPLILGTVAIGVLAGRWIDLSLMILPSQGESLPPPGVWEAGLLLAAGAIFVLAVSQGLRNAEIPETASETHG